MSEYPLSNRFAATLQKIWAMFARNTTGKPKLHDAIRRFLEFMDEHPLETHPVLVHCQAGISRSCSMIAAYLLHKKLCTTVDEAVEFIMVKRSNAFCDGSWVVYRNALNDYFG